MTVIKNRLSATLRVTKTSAKVIWRRLPRIAVYTLAFFVIFSVGDRLFYAYSPPEHFVKYTSFIVQNARQGEDVRFTLCREHRGDYDVSGIRTIYVIPEGKTSSQKVFVHNDRLNGVIARPDCANYLIKDSDFHHSVGSYQLTINLTFHVKYGEEKKIGVSSNIYKVYDNPSVTPDVQVQLNNLRAQVEALQQALQQFNTGSGSPVVIPKSNGSGNSSQPQSVNSSGTGTAPSTVTPVTQAPPASKGTHQECNVNILGIKVGCRDVPN